MIDESVIQRIIEEVEVLNQYLQKPYAIQLYNRSDNLTYKITGKKDIIAKVGMTGWGKYEYNTLKKLFQKGYNVPQPITYVTLQDAPVEGWDFGSMKREIGILFQFLIDGKNLKRNLNKVNILKGLNFLKRLHADRSLKNERITNYQKIEVERGFKYINKLFNGRIVEQLKKRLERYENLNIDYCFIHGGPRLEHFILKDDQIWMVDFESACIGDRFKDLGIYFTELLLNNYNEEELILAYFNRDLNENEKARLEFFKLRALLVKMNFTPSQFIYKELEKTLKL
ncbi:MAG: phosphotransferase family protein [Candidatus Helarchaeota archaeon]